MNKLTKMALEHAQSTAPEPLRGLAAAALKREKRSRATRRERSAPRRAREATAAEAVSIETARIRIAVDVRAGPQCEWCARWVGDEWELHHVESGGLRRSRQTVRNCAKVCTHCHHHYHHSNRGIMRLALGWANRLGFMEAAQIISRRIDKAEAAGARAGRGGPDAGTKEGT